MQLANLLGVTHPTINHLTGEIMNRGYIQSQQDKTDKRKRLLSLTPEGKKLMEVVLPLLEGIQDAAKAVIEESGHDVIEVLEDIEKALARDSYYNRILANMEKRKEST